MAQSINNLAKGMIRGSNPLKKDPQHYNFALNISTSKNHLDRLTRVTENKLEDYYSLKNVNYVILNALYLNLEEYVYFITDQTGSFSEIIHYNKGSITTIYNNNALDFKPTNIISSTYRVNYNGDRLIYFVDGLNPDRVINLDKISLTDSIESISINPIYSYSKILNYNINYGGGNLPSGKYFIFIAPKDINYKQVQFKYLIDGIAIENGEYSNENSIYQVTASNYAQFQSQQSRFENVYGLKEESITNKSININIPNEAFHEFMDIYIIVQNNSEFKVYLREDINYSTNYTISNLENYTELGSDISSIIVDNIIYNNSETLTQKDNRLILANSKLENHNIDFQQIANNIIVTPFTTEEVFTSDNFRAATMSPEYVEGGFVKSETNTAVLNVISEESKIFSAPYVHNKTKKAVINGRTFMRDEVYAFGVYFELDNGVTTDVYHIPGRVPNTSLKTAQYGLADELGRVAGPSITNWDTANVTVDGETKPAWEIINTGLSSFMGYYRCQETYPDGYGFPTDGEKDINGKSYIRHHRIPSEKIYPLLNLNSSSDVYNKILINVEFSNIVLPPEISSRVKNIYFSIADRSELDKKVVSKGIVYATRQYNNEIRNSEVLNTPLAYNNSTKSNTVFEFKSPEVDFKFKNFNIKSSYIKPTALLVGSVLYNSKRFWTQLGYATGTSGRFPFPAAFINSEGINPSSVNNADIIYDYKQEFTSNRINYRKYFLSTLFKQYSLTDSMFVDNNSISNIGQPVRFEGNQNTSVIKLKNTHPTVTNSMFETLDMLPYYPLGYNPQSSNVTKLFRNFFFENSEVLSTDFNDEQRAVTYPDNDRFHDSTLYCTLLSNNNNIFSSILDLRYTQLPTNSSYQSQGDAYIENHFSKKGYSSLVTNNSYTTVRSDYKDNDRIYSEVANNNVLTQKVNNLDMSVSESYISFVSESFLNIRMRRHDGEFNHYPYDFKDQIYPTNALEKKALKQEVYKLNTQYNNEFTIKPLFANRVKLVDLDSQDKKIGNRIIYSELQNNESSIDNFRNFLANNYKDIITTKGNINKLFIKDNALMILTRDSLFTINSSNQYLTTRNGTDVYVGSGEFLASEPDELISLETGYAGTSSKLSFYETKAGYVFVDIIRNKIILFNKSLTDINILGLFEDLKINLYEYFPQLDDGLDKPLIGYGILSGFDPETERLFITKLDYIPTQLTLDEFNSNIISINNGLFYKNSSVLDFNNPDYFENKSFTVTYDTQSNTWISYHSYFPNYYIPNPAIFTPKLDDISKYGNNFADKFILDVTMNENFNIVKVFDSFKFDVRSEDHLGNSNNDFFSDIILYNDRQTTGNVGLNGIPFNNNLTLKEQHWNYNYVLDNSKEQLDKKLFSNEWSLIKDDYYIDKVLDNTQLDFTKPWNKKHRLRDKFINIRLIKDNIDNNKFYINYIIANVRQSIR